jgi:hypothetical protein
LSLVTNFKPGLRAIYMNNENSVAWCCSMLLTKLEAILSVVAWRRRHKATDSAHKNPFRMLW